MLEKQIQLSRKSKDRQSKVMYAGCFVCLNVFKCMYDFMYV